MIFHSPYPDIQIPEVAVQDYLIDRWSKYGTRPALIDGPSGKSLTYSQLSDMVCQAAAGLSELGVEKGDRVAIYIQNTPEYAIIFFAVSMAGGISTTINPLYTLDEVEHQLNDTGAKYLFAAASFLETATKAAKNTTIESIIVLGEVEGTISFSSLLTTNADTPTIEITPREDLIAILYSSGTTGMPKGVMLTHYNFVATMSQLSVAVPLAEHDIIIAVAPFFHIMGLMGFCFDLSMGTTVVIMPRFDLEQYLQLIERYKATILRVAPPIVFALARHPMIEKYDLSTLTYICCGASPISEELIISCAKRLNCEVVQAFGMTETAVSAYITPRNSNMKHPASVGPTVPNTETRIIDISTKVDLGPNEHGEVLIRGPQIMKGYWNNEEATRDTIDVDGWLHTGDVGYVDDDYVYIVDRIKELIKYKGYQIAPVELESILLTHPNIVDAAVIPVPHEETGEIPKAFVVLKDKNGDAEEIMQFVAKRVAPYKKIRQLEFTNEIPKLASGKILRRVLIEQDRKEN